MMATLNFVFAGIVFFQSARDKIAVLYALIAFFASLWAVATLFFEDQRIAFLGHYIAGNLAYLSFFWFSLYYPTRTIKSLGFPFCVTLINFFVLAMVPTQLFFLWGYAVFVIFLSFIYITTEVFMFQKYRISSGLDKVRLSYLIEGTLIAGTLGIFLNLILPWMGNLSFFKLGPIFVTASFTGMSIYTLIRYRLFNVRVVAAEIFVILLVLSLLVRLASYGWSGILDWAVFSFSIVLGFFLIRSVIGEVRSKEKIEELASELKERNEELKKLDKAKSEFISIASHQLRSPLTIIKGYISMILEGSFGEVSEKCKEPLKRTFVSSELLVSLISDLLNLSRIESGKIKYDFKDINLNSIVTGAINELEEIAKDGEVRVEFLDNKSKSIQVNGDEGKLHEVFMNLLDNAIKYSPKGRVEIKIFESDGKALISFTDNGIGVSKEDIGKIFSKFGRTEASQRIRPDGMGIGLYFVRRVVDDHKGRVWMESKGEGRGSTFFVELPMRLV